MTRSIGAIVLWLLVPAAAGAQDAGVPPPRPEAHTDAGTPAIPSPEAAARGHADSSEPIDDAGDAVARAEGWLEDGQRRDAIRHGVVNGYYYEVGRTMRRSFHPDLVAIESERRRGMDFFGIIADEAQRYGPPEPPISVPGTPTPEMRGRTPEDVAMQQQFDMQSLLNAHTRWTRVEVHVVQNREGEVLEHTITHSSGSHTLDEAALAAVTAAAGARPPDQVLGERQAIDSDWVFWAGEVVPYVGQAGCIEGVDGEGMQCTAMGRPLLRTRVELVDVHDAEHERTVRVAPPARDRAAHLAPPVRPPPVTRRDVAPELLDHALPAPQ